MTSFLSNLRSCHCKRAGCELYLVPIQPYQLCDPDRNQDVRRRGHPTVRGRIGRYGRLLGPNSQLGPTLVVDSPRRAEAPQGCSAE